MYTWHLVGIIFEGAATKRIDLNTRSVCVHCAFFKIVINLCYGTMQTQIKRKVVI